MKLYSNHPETIIKYFVTNLNKHKHSIRERASRLLMQEHSERYIIKRQIHRRINFKAKYLHHHKENTAENKQQSKVERDDFEWRKLKNFK